MAHFAKALTNPVIPMIFSGSFEPVITMWDFTFVVVLKWPCHCGAFHANNFEV